jgi:hypothetical protein
MSITKLAQAAAAITLMLSTAPAFAVTKADRQEIGASLERAGVRLIFTEHCEAGLQGLYHHGRKTMTVCTAALRYADEVDEVIAHESIHAAQHCAAQRLGKPGLMPLLNLLSDNTELSISWLQLVNSSAQRKAASIHASSNFNTQGITPELEREAYAFEDDALSANTLFKAACLGE